MGTICSVPFQQIDINMGFWQKRQQLNRDVTIHAVLDRFMDTGRFDAFRCDWREGQPNRPHIFWDSDVAKWIESVAYLIEKAPAPELEKVVEATIDEMERHQTPDGYVNSYYTSVEPSRRWSNRDCHELYCVGHLMEAAVAWKNATGRDRFLKIMCRYADYIDRVFRAENSAAFSTPGHEEIELALVKLYHATGNEKYLALSKHFIDERGCNDKDPERGTHALYRQSHLPCREQFTAEGHAVRACYLYAGMADIAREYNDAALQNACEALFDNIVSRRMYITGGLGSNHACEAFSDDYDLPNETAYTETCAAISMCYFAQRLLLLKNDSRYADAIERIFYNGFLSGVSLSGKEFFYTNPMEINLCRHKAYEMQANHDWLPITERVEVFDCSCCPPNVTRFFASIGDYIYTQDETGINLHQYIGSKAAVAGGTLTIETEYPANGDITVTAQNLAGKQLRLRIPGWCESFTLDAPYASENGYAVVTLGENTVIHLTLDMKPQLMEGNPAIVDTIGKAALMRGPVVYCLEGIDHDGYLGNCFVKADSAFREEANDEYGMPVLHGDGVRLTGAQEGWLYRPVQQETAPQALRFIPYYAFANRGATDLRVWVPLKK